MAFFFPETQIKNFSIQEVVLKGIRLSYRKGRISKGEAFEINVFEYVLLQTKLLKKACAMLVAEKEDKQTERETTLAERVPPLQLSGLSVQDLQVI